MRKEDGETLSCFYHLSSWTLASTALWTLRLPEVVLLALGVSFGIPGWGRGQPASWDSRADYRTKEGTSQNFHPWAPQEVPPEATLATLSGWRLCGTSGLTHGSGLCRKSLRAAPTETSAGHATLRAPLTADNPFRFTGRTKRQGGRGVHK